MRASVASLSKKLLSTIFAATLALGLVPAAGFADIGESENSESANADSIEMTDQDVISSEGDEVPEVEKSAPIEQNEGEALATSWEEDQTSVVPAAMERVSEDVALTTRTVAQAESTRSYFLATTLESTRTVPIVSANLPLDTGASREPSTDGASSSDEGGEGSDESDLPTSNIIAADSTVIGSFAYLGMTFAVEPGGETVALMAVDYNKLPESFIEMQVIAIPEAVTPDGIDYYSVTRIADNAFSSLTKDNANPDYTGCVALFSDEELLSEAGIDAFEVEAFLSPETEMIDIDGDGQVDIVANPLKDCPGILALGIPASVSSIGDKAFAGCDTLQYIVIDENNPIYASYDGALYSADLTNLRLIPGGRVGAVRVAPSATDVDLEAFSHCPSSATLVADPEDMSYTPVIANPQNIASMISSVVCVSSFLGESRKLNELFLMERDRLEDAGSYWMTLDGNGGKIEGNDTWKTQIYPGTDCAGIVPLAYRDGFIFTGYSTNSPDYFVYNTSDVNGMAIRNNDGFIFSNNILIYTGDIYLLAQWRPGLYCRVKLNGGTINGSSADVANTVEYQSFHGSIYYPGGIKRDGYEYNGIWTEPTGGKLAWGKDGNCVTDSGHWNASRLWTRTSGDTFYVQWVAHPYIIQFNANGKSASGMPGTITTKYDDNVMLGSPTCSGYTFLGWNTAPDGSGTSWAAGTWKNLGGLENNNEVVTLYAQWQNSECDVTFDPDMDGFDPITTTCTFNEKAPDLDKIGAVHENREGYRFVGYFDEKGTKYYNAEGEPMVANWNKAGASTLAARWTYYLVLDENAGTDAVTLGSGNTLSFADKAIDGTTRPTAEVVKGQTISLYDASATVADLATRTRDGKPTGYTFTGFHTDDALTASFREGVPPAPNAQGYATLHLGWRANEYEITFDGNGGSGGQAGETAMAEYDSPMPDIDTAKPTRTGWTFAGWYDAKTGGTPYYNAGGSSLKDWDKAEGATLYARWTQDTYRIEFVASDPEGEAINHYAPGDYIEPITDVVYGEALSGRTSDAYALKCTGYNFLGWSTDEDATEVDSTFLFNEYGEGVGTYETAGNTTLYSIWAPRTVKVVFKPNVAGIDEVETAQTFNQNLKDVPAFHRFGYELEGWYRNEAGTTGKLDTSAAFRPSQSDLDAESITYFAKWAPVTYTVTLYPGEHGSYSSEATDAVADGGVRGGYKIVHDYTVEEKEWSFVRPKAEGGYKFAGWQQLKGSEWVDCAGSVDPDSFKAGSELAFQAKWTASEATVTLNLNGAPSSEQAPGFTDTLTYSIDSEAVLPIPLWEGHTFQGWKLVERGGEELRPAEDVTSVVGTAGTVPEDVVCQAQWVSDTYTIKFLRSAAFPTEIAPEQKVGRDDAIAFVEPSFTQAFDIEGTDAASALADTSRIFLNYKIEKGKAGTGKDVLFYPGDEPTSMAELMKAYPNLLDSDDRTPQNGSTIVFYADWALDYNVVVPLKASIAFDPERIAEDPTTALKAANVAMRLPDKDAPAVEVVSLVCEPTATTKTAFDSDKAFYDHAYLTLSAKQRSASGASTVPVELNLGAAIEKGSLSIRDVKHPTTSSVLSLPDIGFSFGGSNNDDRILDLTFGIRFDSSVDPANLKFLNSPSFKNTGNTIDLANVYYTLAMKRTNE